MDKFTHSAWTNMFLSHITVLGSYPSQQSSFPKAPPLPLSLCSQWMNCLLIAIHDIFEFLLSFPKLLFLLLPFLLPCWAFDFCLPSVESMTYFSPDFIERPQLSYLTNFWCYQVCEVAIFCPWYRKTRQLPGCSLNYKGQNGLSRIFCMCRGAKEWEHNMKLSCKSLTAAWQHNWSW